MAETLSRQSRGPRQPTRLYSPVTKTVSSVKIKALLSEMPTFSHLNRAIQLWRNFQQLNCSRKLTVTTTQVPHKCRCISQAVTYRHTQDSYSKLRDKTAIVTELLSSVTSGRVRPPSSSRFQLFSRNVICYNRKKLKKKNIDGCIYTGEVS